MSDSTEAREAGGPVSPDGDEPASQTAPVQAARPGAFFLLGRAWRGFRAWRRSRPFWAGIWLIIAGAELLLIPLPIRDMGIILHIGIGGISGILIGAVLILAALLLWFHPAQHVFYSIVAVLLAIAALVASNLGGFLIGTVLGILGGSLGFAWMPGRPERRRGRRRKSPDEPDAGIALVGTDAAAGAGAETDARTDGTTQAEASASTDAQVSAFAAEPDQLAAAPRADDERGTALRTFSLVPILALLVALASATGLSSILDPSSAASSPSACSSTPTASAAPSPSPTASCSPSPTASADPTPDPTTTPSPSAGASTGASPSAAAGSGEAGPSPSASPTPTGTPPPFAVSTAQSTLTASSATITGFAYDGVVSAPTATGTVQIMQFSATSLDLTGVQLTVSQGSATQTTTAASLDLTGDVVLYATELSGDLFGAPITITPGTPVATILQVLGETGLSQVGTQIIPLQMTNVTTLQPYTSANNMSASALDIS